MSLSSILTRRSVTTAAALVLAGTGVALAGSASADGCTPTDNHHTAAQVIHSTGTVTSPVNATGCYYGVYVAPGANGTITSATISNYFKAGVFVDGTDADNPASATITGSEVNGYGTTDQVAQNGIEFWGPNASGVVRGNTIDGHSYSGSSWTATGILLFDVDASAVKTSNNKFLNNQKNLALITDSSCAQQYGGFYGDAGLCY